MCLFSVRSVWSALVVLIWHGLLQICNPPLHTFIQKFNLAAKWLSYIFCCHVMQQATYESVVDYWESRGQGSGPDEVAHLGVITALKKICNHPSLVILHQSESLPGEVLSHTTCRFIQNLTHKCSDSSNGLSQSSNLNFLGSFWDINLVPVPGKYLQINLNHFLPQTVSHTLFQFIAHLLISLNVK